ncbi:MAG: phosphoglycerate kinase, partial [Chloroflexi bacterium]|nr:phosphoglycerate kinase [Chloroflexota bacterium]
MKQTVRDIDVGNKRVLVRVDFNVPLAHGKVADDARLQATVPTIELLRQQKAKVILISHLGRPKGTVKESLRLTPVAARLSELLELPVHTAPDSIGPAAASAVHALQPGDVLLLENVRFHPEEEQNDPDFARHLASLAAVFVNDAFGAAHRAHASTHGITAYLPSVAGLLMEKEIATLSQLLHAPEEPFVALIGGAKISTKIGVLTHLLKQVDVFVLGGGIANTLLKAQGIAVGESLVEDGLLSVAAEFMAQAEEANVAVVLPRDAVVGTVGDAATAGRVVGIDAIPVDTMIGDIGPATVKDVKAVLASAGTVLWNGPLGLFEEERFAGSTRAIAQALADCAATTIVGGGETVAAVELYGAADDIS